MANASFGGWRHRAAHFYFLLILFAFPLFSAPCPKGLCSSPVEVVAVHLVYKGVNDAIAKVLIYPSALFTKMESIVGENEPISFPDWHSLLNNITTSLRDSEKSDRTFGLALIIGSYLCLAGAIASVVAPTPFSALGPLLLLWSIYKEGAAHEDVYALPMFSVALFCAVSGINFLGKVPGESNPSDPSRNSPADPSRNTPVNDEKSKPSSSDKKRK